MNLLFLDALQKIIWDFGFDVKDRAKQTNFAQLVKCESCRYTERQYRM